MIGKTLNKAMGLVDKYVLDKGRGDSAQGWVWPTP